MSTNGRAGDNAPPKKKAKKPPRPRRAVEAEYLAALADAVPLARWRRIVNATADLAEKGDAKSREWLARYLLGAEPPSLVALAAEAAEGTPLGDTALLSRLIGARKDADYHRLYDRAEYGAALMVLGGLDRTGGDPAPGEGGNGEAARVVPALPAPAPANLEISG